MSASVPLGETALFICAGEGVGLLWNVNGIPDGVQENQERGVVVVVTIQTLHYTKVISQSRGPWRMTMCPSSVF